MSSISYGEKLRTFWAPNRWFFLWLVFSLAPLFFFETFVHEGLHWLTAVAAGADPVLIPFAHFNTRFGTAGENLNGATLNTGGFSAMPQIVCLLLLIGAILLFIFTSPRARFIRMFLVWWYLGLAVDLLFNTIRAIFGAQPPGTDWGKFAAESGDGIAILLSILILALVLSQLIWIAFSRWHENRPGPPGFFQFRGAALFLAILSLIALIWSLAAGDPSIVRNWWFWLIWVWQAASFLWFIVYRIWATAKEG